MMRAIDHFSGAGGFSTGATMPGCEVVVRITGEPDEN